MTFFLIISALTLAWTLFVTYHKMTQPKTSISFPDAVMALQLQLMEFDAEKAGSTNVRRLVLDHQQRLVEMGYETSIRVDHGKIELYAAIPGIRHSAKVVYDNL